MKLLIKSIVILMIICLSIFADDYFIKWINYDYLTFGDDTRGLVYNPKTDHVLVATKLGGARVIILDAANGDSLGMMNTSGIGGGTYDIDQIGISDDGKIYVCNLSAPQYTPGSTFKVYKYANELDAPTLVFDDALSDYRFGDSFSVIGSGNDIYVYSSGQGHDQMVVLRDNGSTNLVFDTFITLPQAGNARHGISPTSGGGKVWINGADSGYPPPRLITHTGVLVATVPDTIVSAAGSSNIIHKTFGQYNLITVTNAVTATIRSARYYVDALGTVTFDYFGGNSDSSALFSQTGLNSNANASAAISYDTRRHALITLMGNNSIASVGMDSLLKASTPRAGILEISMNELNEFFPTDFVGSSNNRDLYFTWSDGKLFLGALGNTLIDPTLSNYMYIAFDVDPSGANGSDIPPLLNGGIAGNVTHLPFNADYVYMVEPWNQTGYMIGSIYEWNGSSWVEYLFDGNNANQGALAYADTIDGKIAKFAAIRRNDVPGIGQVVNQAVSMMAYVVESGTSGDVLCAFPDQNTIGNNVGFDYYYYMQELGSGMFPIDTSYVNVINSNPNSIEIEKENVLEGFILKQNYPNPFNPQTKITYNLPKKTRVKLEIFNITGQKVSTLIDQKQKAGKQEIVFNAGDLSSGIYFYKITANDFGEKVRKLILLK